MAAAIVDTDRWIERLGNTRYALQFLGACGRGKSTHLLALLALCPDGAYVYLPEDGRLPEIPIGTPLFVDEAQRLPWWTRIQVLRRRVPLILGTHQDLSGPLERAGYGVESVNVTALTSPARVQQVLNRRIELARLGPGELPQVSAQIVSKLMKVFGDDIRSMEDCLYETFQAATETEMHAVCRNVI